MDKSELHERLRELHGELHRVELVDERERQDLEDLMVDIQELLDKNDDSDVTVYERLQKRLGQAVERFEVSHPTVTLLMGEAIERLARMGI